MLAVYWIVLSPIVDQTISINNALNGSGIVYTQERANAIDILRLGYDAYLVFAVITLVLWLLIQSLREREGNVW